MYETINSPINYGGLELKNRIIFAPTTFGLAEDEYFEKIRKIAAGGCAMVIIGDVPVGKSQFEKSLFDKKGFAYYQKLAEIVHSYDCRICAQLHQTDSNMLAMLKYVPGVLTKKISMEELRPLLNAEVAPYISKLSTRKIHKIINGFGEAAVLAVKAGFDMVQVHGDRMCGSFSSTVFNHRTDEYGGNTENRTRFLREIIADMRAKAGTDYPLSVRLTVAAPRTVPALRWRPSRPSAAVCRRFPSTTSWPSGRKIPTMAMPVWWSPSWVFLYRC